MAKKETNYSVAMHFPKNYEKSFDNYKLFSQKLLNIDPRLTEEPKKLYIGFKISDKVAAAVRVQKQKLILELYRVEPADLRDEDNKVTYKNNSLEDFNKHVSLFYIRTVDDIDYAVDLSMQVIKKHFT